MENEGTSPRVTREYLHGITNAKIKGAFSKDSEGVDSKTGPAVVHQLGISYILEGMVKGLIKQAEKGKSSTVFAILEAVKDRSNDNKKVSEAIKILGLTMSEEGISILIYCYVENYMKHMHPTLDVEIDTAKGLVSIKW